MGVSRNLMAERYRELLAAPAFIELIGCHDALSAMVAEQSGFQAVFLSGYSVAASTFGNPDIGLTTLSETCFLAGNMIRRLKIPVIVDIDNGYGNEDNVIRAVHELESAGAAGIILEDQVLPKQCGHTANKRVLPVDEYLRKLDAALRCRQTPLVVVARTDAAPLDEAIRRANIYHAAGADVTLIDGVSSAAELQRITDEVPGPKQVNLIYGGKTPLQSAPELFALGFKVILYSTPTLFLAMQSLQEWLPRLHRTHDLSVLSPVSAHFKEFQRFIEELYLRHVHGQKDS